MIIPPRLQIFDHPVHLSSKDAARLSPHLASWRDLHAILMLGVNVPDLERMVIIELLGKSRHHILRRLTARIASLKYDEQWQTIDRILQP